jgi:hypothetical protein
VNCHAAVHRALIGFETQRDSLWLLLASWYPASSPLAQPRGAGHAGSSESASCEVDRGNLRALDKKADLC